MNRTAKKLLTLATSIAIALSVGFSAFAEQATPENAAPVEYAQTLVNEPAGASTQDAVTDPTVTSVLIDPSLSGKAFGDYATLQEAIDAAMNADIQDRESGSYTMAIMLKKNVEESVVVGKNNSGINIQIMTEGYTVTAKDGPAFTLNGDTGTFSISGDADGGVDGGQYAAVYNTKNNASMVFISGGTFASKKKAIINEGTMMVHPGPRIDSAEAPDIENSGELLLMGGTYTHPVDESNIMDGYEQIERDGLYTVIRTTNEVAFGYADSEDLGVFTDLDTAIRAVSEKATQYGSLSLMKDVKYSVSLPKNQTRIAFDTHGYRVTASDKAAITLESGAKICLYGSEYGSMVVGGRYPAVTVEEGAELVIASGTYTSDVDPIDNHGTVTITGGTFNKKLDESLIAAGYEQVAKEGMYVVQKTAEEENYVAEAGGKKFDLVQMAVYQQGEKGDVVKLLKNVTENVYINANTNVVIDLDGHTLTQKSGGQLNAVIDNNGTLTIRGGGALAGTLAMYNENAVTYLESRDQLQGNLADGVAFMKDKVDDMYAIMTYSVETATRLTKAIGTADKAVKSFYGNTQQLSALTADQVKNANNMKAEDKQLIEEAYTALKSDETAVQRVLATENYAMLEASRQIVLDLYNACRNHEIDTENKDVVSEVDASKAEAPTTDAEVPADKQPTAEDAKKAVEKIVAEVTANTTVNDFKDNGLTQVVDLTKLPEAASAGRLVFSVQVSLQKVELDAQVIKDSNGIVTEIKLPGKTLVFNVEPMVSVDGGAARKLENSQLNGGAVTVRLPIPKDVADKYAVVAHAGDADRYLTIYTAENGDKYIEFTTTHFSDFVVTFTDELPKAAETEQATAPVQTPAPKQDDSAYYTCKACGYHDWTAVDGGYKCNHCGYIESVKQLAGYPNVKGTATVGKAAANAGTTKAAMSAIPQTSDDMPITALAVSAIAALLGLGVTVALKRKNQ